MPFTTYELARPWARAIREEILERRMPPWGAVAGFGHFSNDVSLTQREMDIILSWADGGAPSGVLKAEESIPPVFVPAAPLWDAGAPDEVLSPEKASTLVPGSGDQIRRFEVSAGFSPPRAVRTHRLQARRSSRGPLRRGLRICDRSMVVDVDAVANVHDAARRRRVSPSGARTPDASKWVPRDRRNGERQERAGTLFQ